MRITNKNNLFEIQVEDWKKDNIKRLNLAKNKIAKKILSRLCNRSPIITGTYCKSHLVDINKKPTKKINQLKIPLTDKTTVKIETILKGSTRINTSKIFDTIWIGNTAPYALRVEYLGWPQPRWTGRQGPYHVYGLTEEEMRHEAPRIVAKLKNQKMS
jgi:hypothetical protein